MLEVNGISKFYGTTMAVQNITFSAARGQVVGLVGHNGSGKSTTMNIITHCLTPTAGSVTVDGIPVQQQPLQAKARIGYLPELPPVYPDLLVEEQLAFACGLRDVPARRQKAEIDRVCDALAITGVRRRLIANLSKGYRQRVGFAQALVGAPPLLVLDEPTVGLDPRQIIELRALIGRLKTEHTILLSSHILSEIAATCDRVVILSSGRLAADEPLDRLLERASAQEGLRLQADGPAGAVADLVRGVPGVQEVQIEDGPPDTACLHIRPRPGCDIHRPLFYALAEANFPVRSLTPVQVGLEDIFLQLTHDRRYQADRKGGDAHAGHL